MSVVVGIDPSLTATGLAAPGGCITITTKPGDPKRLQVIHDTVFAAVEEADLAVIEDLPTHAHGAGLTGMAQGVIRLACIRADVPFATVPAATLKVYATGKGNATKADMRLELFKRTGLDLRDDNQVDALFLRYLGLHLVGQHELDLPKTHLRALEKVTRP